jgi:hypothetical protein
MNIKGCTAWLTDPNFTSWVTPRRSEALTQIGATSILGFYGTIASVISIGALMFTSIKFENYTRKLTSINNGPPGIDPTPVRKKGRIWLSLNALMLLTASMTTLFTAYNAGYAIGLIAVASFDRPKLNKVVATITRIVALCIVIFLDAFISFEFYKEARKLLT